MNNGAKIFLMCMMTFLLAPGSARTEESEPVAYGTGTWMADSLGNHRAVVRVDDSADAVWAAIQWRRSDFHPELKNIIVVDATTQKRIANVCPVRVDREAGDVVFQPVSGEGEYYVYYFPTIMSGWQYMPDVQYQEPQRSADKSWLARNGLSYDAGSDANPGRFPKARLLEIQSIDEFNSFYPMEVIATAEEVERLLGRHSGASYLLFPEDRAHPIRMKHDIPLRWIESDARDDFSGEARRGEYFTFQVGVYAAQKSLSDLKIRCDEFRLAGTNGVIPSSQVTCFNTQGIDWKGEPFTKKVAVSMGDVQALWFGIDIPGETAAGIYEGSVTITPENAETQRIRILLTITDEHVADSGDSEPWRHSRLRWLNSRIALDDEIVQPFVPLTVEENSISCLGRMLTIGRNGLPSSIRSMFSQEMTRIGNRGREILASPMRFVIESPDGQPLRISGGGYTFTGRSNGRIGWKSESRADALILRTCATMEADGFVEYTVSLSSTVDVSVNDIRLEIPVNADAAKYMMGMGETGGYRAGDFSWKWDREKLQDAIWIGDVNAGLQLKLFGENYVRPLINIYYHYKPLNMPRSWFNEGKGGCTVHSAGNGIVLLKAYSGARVLKAGETLEFNFSLLITPFKTLDTHGQWHTRYYHAYEPVENVVKAGANTINNHHASPINPYINYPFLRVDQMKSYIDRAHEKNVKVKIYYTVRELTNHVTEMWALRSLDNEIFADGPGGGYSWLQEHLKDDYIRAWYAPNVKDAAIITSGMSRWHNYYLEGLDWLSKNVGIDGLYIDDVAYDRTVMKRTRKILDRDRAGSLIDLHSWNHFNERAGFANCANLYMENFPYIDRLWFGEGFDYNESPDYYLVEISGIPFGLMSEMLQDGGNPWRGMVYGMTNRLPHSGDPRPIWKLWDEFGIQDSRMIGYWNDTCPVKTNNKYVLATVYRRRDRTLVSIASWADANTSCRLSIDWNALNIDPEHAEIEAPDVENFQRAASFNPGDAIPVEKGKGWLLILRNKDGQ